MLGVNNKNTIVDFKQVNVSWEVSWFLSNSSETYPEPSQTSKIERFAKIVSGLQGVVRHVWACPK